MSKNEIIKTHSFEKAIGNLKKFSNKTSTDLGLDKVETSGGLFGWFDHNVTGEELNQITAQIQDYLINFNSLQNDFINEFKQVYLALESLDKDYIPGILSAIKGAEIASNQAKAANEDIKKIISEQQKTIKILEEHKRKLDQLQHLSSIDDLWNIATTLNNEMIFIKQTADEFKCRLDKADESIKSLQRFANAILDYEHFEDIDEMWDNIEQLMMSLESHFTMINEINSNISFIFDIIHLKDVDIMWNDVEKHKEDISKLQLDANNLDKEVNGLKSNTNELINQLNQRVNEADDMLKNHAMQLGELNNLSNSNAQRILEIQKSINDNSSSIEALKKQTLNIVEDISFIKNKLKIIYILGGSAVGVLIIEMLLRLAGVL